MNQNIPSRFRPTASDAAAVVAALTSMFASFRERSDDVEGMVRHYALMLEDVPTWAVVRACERFAKGRVPDRHNNAFAPTVAELHALADDLVAEQDRRTRPALPPPSEPYISPEERERVGRRFVAFQTELKRAVANAKMEDAKDRAKYAEHSRDFWEAKRVEECRAEGLDPAMGISPALYRLVQTQSPTPEEAA
jgi:hypothetical protein